MMESCGTADMDSTGMASRRDSVKRRCCCRSRASKDCADSAGTETLTEYWSCCETRMSLLASSARPGILRAPCPAGTETLAGCWRLCGSRMSGACSARPEILGAACPAGTETLTGCLLIAVSSTIIELSCIWVSSQVTSGLEYRVRIIVEALGFTETKEADWRTRGLVDAKRDSSEIQIPWVDAMVCERRRCRSSSLPGG